MPSKTHPVSWSRKTRAGMPPWSVHQTWSDRGRRPRWPRPRHQEVHGPTSGVPAPHPPPHRRRTRGHWSSPRRRRPRGRLYRSSTGSRGRRPLASARFQDQSGRRPAPPRGRVPPPAKQAWTRSLPSQRWAARPRATSPARRGSRSGASRPGAPRKSCRPCCRQSPSRGHSRSSARNGRSRCAKCQPTHPAARGVRRPPPPPPC